jgi:UDP:flavonoid glycosyltransferase YjiC (YdhE family)
MGIGTAPIPRKQLTVDKLAAAIREVTNSHSMRERAAELGSKIAAEDGVGEAVRVVQQYLA